MKRIECAYSRIKNLLTKSGDQRICELATNGYPEVDQLVGFLIQLLPTETFEVRFLTPGKSGAKVLLVVFPGQNVPRLVKFGEFGIIEKEWQNFDSVVQNIVPANSRVDLVGSLIHSEEYAAIMYTWAGGAGDVRTFKDFFFQSDFDSVIGVTDQLITVLAQISGAKLQAKSPFDLWSWRGDMMKRVNSLIRRSGLAAAERKRLTDALKIPGDWRSKLVTRRCLAGVCHGDLNVGNVLVSRAGSNDFQPVLIDYASVETQQSPAKDWAKLERDIKFRCLAGSFPSPEQFSNAVLEVDEHVEKGGRYTGKNQGIKKAITAIQLIRKRFFEVYGNKSEMADVEYQFFLLQHTLAYSVNDDKSAAAQPVKLAALKSALRSLNSLESALDRLSDVSAVEDFQKSGSLKKLKGVSLCGTKFDEAVLCGAVEDRENGYRIYYHCKEANHSTGGKLNTKVVTGGFSGSVLVRRKLAELTDGELESIQCIRLAEGKSSRDSAREAEEILSAPGNIILLDGPEGKSGTPINWITRWIYEKYKNAELQDVVQFLDLSSGEKRKHPGEYKCIQWHHQKYVANKSSDFGVIVRFRNPINPKNGYVLLLAGLHAPSTHAAAEICSSATELRRIGQLPDMQACFSASCGDPQFEAVFSIPRRVGWNAQRKPRWLVCRPLI
jgi:hypothetical protein